MARAGGGTNRRIEVSLTPEMLVEALSALNRPARAPEILAVLQSRIPGRSLKGARPDATVRAQLQHYCLDSKIYQGPPNLFIRIERGLWDLKSRTVEGRDRFIEDPVGFDLDFEGRQRLHQHVARERSARLIRRFKLLLKNFRCTICGFDCQKRYGKLGSKFIEAHHTRPISDGERRARIQDLIAVCSNCHRMLHRLHYQAPESSGEEVRLNLVAIVSSRR